MILNFNSKYLFIYECVNEWENCIIVINYYFNILHDKYINFNILYIYM